MDKNYLSFPGLGIEEFAVSPVAFKIGDWPIAWYGIIITCGIVLAYLYAQHRAKREAFKTDDLIDYFLFGMIFGVLGARFYYVFTKLDTYVVEGDIGKTLYNMIAIWEGGLAIYGGIIAGAVTVFIVSRIKKQSFLQVVDIVIPGVQLAQAIGRWGNFVNAEAHGGVTDLPWRMGIRTSEMVTTVYVHPTFLYESIWNLCGFFFIHFFVTPRRKYFGQSFLCYLVWYGFGRMLIEGLRTDSLYVPGTEIRISQLVAVLCVVIGASLLLYFAVTGKSSKALRLMRSGTIAESDRNTAENEETPSAAENGEEAAAEHEDEKENDDVTDARLEQEAIDGTDH